MFLRRTQTQTEPKSSVASDVNINNIQTTHFQIEITINPNLKQWPTRGGPIGHTDEMKQVSEAPI